VSKNKQKQGVSPEQELGLTLDDLVKRGARQVIQQAIEAELAELLSICSNVTMLHGKRAVVRNGYLPGREVLTGAGPIQVKVPKVRDRSGSGIKCVPHARGDEPDSDKIQDSFETCSASDIRLLIFTLKQ
jgi:hypothetical protein